MSHDKIKSFFTSAVESVVSSISDFAVHPENDFTRNKKFPADKLITFMVSEGSSPTKNELLDFFDMATDKPTDSASNQQRAKLKPKAIETVFQMSNNSASSLIETSDYRYIAADGSTVTYFSRPKFSPSEYFVEPGHSAKGFYSIHINAFYDLTQHTYTGALLQPVHEKDESRAFCDIVGRHPVLPGSKNVYIGDRGYCPYNNMAHVIGQGQYFLFRTKDIHSKGLVGSFDFPEEGSFDIPVKATLVRSHSKKTTVPDGYKRFVDRATPFDYIEYGSRDTYGLSFRIVRFPLSETSYGCIVTNLPADGFPIRAYQGMLFCQMGNRTFFPQAQIYHRVK